MNYIVLITVYILSVAFLRYSFRKLAKLDLIPKEDAIADIWWFVPGINTGMSLVAIVIFGLLWIFEDLDLNKGVKNKFLRKLFNLDL